MIGGAMQPFALTLDKFLEHAAKWRGDREVVTGRADGTIDRIGYADLKARSHRVSAVLLELGVSLGDHVATLGWNSQNHMEAWYGIMGIGAVCHTLNPRLSADHLAAMLVLSRAPVMLVSGDLMDLARQVARRLPTPPRLLVMDGAGTGQEAALEALIAEPEVGAAWGGFDETAPSGLCFTSGTTGPPKGVTYTHRSSFLHTMRILQVDGMAISGEDAVLAVVPMFHANGWGLPFAAPAVGAKLVLPGRQADGASLARLIAAEAVTVAVGVPTVWLGLLEQLDAVGGHLPSLKRIIVGGAPMPPALMARLEERLGVTVQTSWGMTELSPSGTVAAAGDLRRHPDRSGRPAIGVDLMVADDLGQPLAMQRGVEGHLLVRGAAVVERYFGAEEKATNREGWFATGDLARIEPDGDLVITGRVKDLIKSGGEWINPAEIEAVVNALPQVALAAVIGRADSRWGERPILLVQLREPATDAALLSPLKGKVPNWWAPDEVVRLSAMPLAATGKIDKLQLRSEYGRVRTAGAT